MSDRDGIIMANARRLIKRTRMRNQELYSELFGVGSITAWRRCAELGLDPDGRSAKQKPLKTLGSGDE